MVKYYTEIDEEVRRAEAKHPHFPAEPIHAVAIVCEESGEAIRAAVQWEYEGGSLDDVRTELIHTAATCIRALHYMEES